MCTISTACGPAGAGTAHETPCVNLQRLRMSGEMAFFQRPDGRLASRAQLLVVPSVTCASAVAERIASQVPAAVAVRHQHGCAQIGDDAVMTSSSLERLAAHPNAWATLVVSLGCETLQGGELVRRLKARGVRCELVGIQTQGGSSATVERGVAILAQLSPSEPQRTPATARPRVALAAVGDVDLAVRDAEKALREAGFEVAGPRDVTRGPVLGLVELVLGEEALGLVLVADRGLPLAPVLVPTLAVASTGDLQERSEGAFDLAAPTPTELVASVRSMLAGSPTKLELEDEPRFAVRREALSL